MTFPTHERYESGLAATGHQFWAWRGQGIKDWNKTYAPLPLNYTLLDSSQGDQQIPPDIVFDVILSQNKLGAPASQFKIAESLSRSLHVPFIHLEHTLPHVDWNKGKILRLKQMKADYNVFISEFSRSQWLWDENEAIVIEHGISTGRFRPDPAVARRPVILAVVNDWINRDWCCGFNLWKQVTDGLPCFVMGDTPGLSRPAQSLEELVWRYQSSSIFINTATASPIPTVMLEAMASGCAVVSTENEMTRSVVKNGVNGYITNDPKVMRSYLERLLDSPEECYKLGTAARATIEDRFNLSDFVSTWQRLFAQAASTLPVVRGKDGRPITVEM